MGIIKKFFSANIVIALSTFTLLFLLKSPALDIPHFGDSAAYDLTHALWLKTHNFDIFPVDPNFHGLHPPLSYLIFAIFYKAFGTSLKTGHMVAIIFSSLTLYFTYKIGSFVGNNKRTGLIAALLLLCSALFFAQSGIAQMEVVFTTFVTITIYFALKEEILPYLVSAACMVLTKMPSIIFLAVIISFEFYRYNGHRGGKHMFQSI